MENKPIWTAVEINDVKYFVDEKNKNEHGWYLNKERVPFNRYTHLDECDFKIMAQSPNSKLEGVPFVESGENVEALAIERYGNDPNMFGGQRDGFIEGYKAAKANEFSEGDIPKLLNHFLTFVQTDDGISTKQEMIINYLNSGGLKGFQASIRPKLISVEPEMKECIQPESCNNSLSKKCICLKGPICYTKEVNGKPETFVKIRKYNYE